MATDQNTKHTTDMNRLPDEQVKEIDMEDSLKLKVGSR